MVEAGVGEAATAATCEMRMKRFAVRWRFGGGYESDRTSMVLARDEEHAKKQVWMNHVDVSELRKKIEFISVEEIER